MALKESTSGLRGFTPAWDTFRTNSIPLASFDTAKQAHKLGLRVNSLKEEMKKSSNQKFGAAFDAFLAPLKPQLEPYNYISSALDIKNKDKQNAEKVKKDAQYLAEVLLTIAQESPTLQRNLDNAFDKESFPDLNFGSMYTDAKPEAARKRILDEMTKTAEGQYLVLQVMRNLMNKENSQKVREEFVDNLQDSLARSQQAQEIFKKHERDTLNVLVDSATSSPKYDPAYRLGLALGALLNSDDSLEYNGEDLDAYHEHLGDKFPSGQQAQGKPGEPYIPPMNIPQAAPQPVFNPGMRPGSGGG